MENDSFQFQPRCSTHGCGSPARYKVAAPWNDAKNHELKNYGLACQEHRDELLARAREKRAGIHTAEGETIGAVGLYELIPGRRDAELARVSD
jgi:hypothetical protein